MGLSKTMSTQMTTRVKKKESRDDGKTMGMHAKHFIIDDKAYYIGSQNWYVCDLAEWGILVDDANQTRKVLHEYWHPMWQNSYKPEHDCNVDDVLDGLDVDREGESMPFKGYHERQRLLMQAAGHQVGASERRESIYSS